MEINADWSEIAALERMMLRVPGGLPKAMERALNRSVLRTRTLTSTSVRSVYTTAARPVKERLWTTKANARRGVFEARVDPKREGYRRLSLMHFAGVRPKTLESYAVHGNGIRVRIRKDSGGGRLPMAFVGTMRARPGGDPSGLAIFKRQGRRRLPIEKIYGPSTASQTRNAGVRERVVSEAQAGLSDRLAHECRHVLREAGLL